MRYKTKKYINFSPICQKTPYYKILVTWAVSITHSSVLHRFIALLVNQELILSKVCIQILYNGPLSAIVFTISRTRWVVMLHNQMGQSCPNNTMTLLTSHLSFSIPSEVIFLLWSSWRTSKKTVNVLRWLSGNKSLNQNVQIRFAVYYRKKRDSGYKAMLNKANISFFCSIFCAYAYRSSICLT